MLQRLRDGWLDLLVELAHFMSISEEMLVCTMICLFLGTLNFWLFSNFNRKDGGEGSQSISSTDSTSQYYEREIGELRKDKQKLEYDLSSVLATVQILRENLSSLKEDHAKERELTVSMRYINDDNSVTTLQVAQLEAELVSLKASLAESNTKAARYESLLFGMEERAEMEQAELREQISASSLKNSELEFACSLRQRQLEEVNVQLSASHSRVCVLEAERDVSMEWKEQHLSGSLQELIEVKASLAETKSQKALLEQDNLKLNSETKRLDVLLQDAVALSLTNEADKRTAQAENRKLRADLIQKSVAVQDSRVEHATLTSRCEDLEKKLQLKRTPKTIQEASPSSETISVLDLLVSPMKPVADLYTYATGGATDAERQPQSFIAEPAPSNQVTTPSRSSIATTHYRLSQKQAGFASPVHLRSPSAGEPPSTPPSILGAKMHHLAAQRGSEKIEG